MRSAAFVFMLVLLASCASGDGAIKHLNNLVAELWAKKSLPSAAVQEWTFTNPYDGWVFFSCDIRATGDDSVRLCIDSQSKDSAIMVADAKSDRPAEAMRHLTKGEHTATLLCEGKPTIVSVVIRAIPELIYSQYPAVPFVTQHGAYDWAYIQKHIAANANCISVAGYEQVLASDRSTLQAWKAQGKKWVFNSGIPGSDLDGGSEPLEDSYKVWYNHKGFQEPLADGIIVDEFIFGPKDKRYATWAAAIDKIYEDPKMKDKVFYAWTACEPMYGGPEGVAFLDTLVKHGGKAAVEYYIPEPPTLAKADEALKVMKSDLGGWEKARKGANRYMVATLGYMSAPNETLDIDPTVDFKVFMDRMMHLLANDPDFKGLYGLIWYLSPYADEENVRWGSRLFRHYAIEGKKNMLSDEMGFKYQLDHLVNPDFEDGFTGWTCSPAEEGSITGITQDGWSWLQGRWPQTTKGNACLLMKSTAKGPNSVTQTIKNLKPGKLYSLKMYTGDRQDMLDGVSIKRPSGLTIAMAGVEYIPDRCFDQWVDSCYSHAWGKFDRTNKYWINYRWRVFRAKETTAKLTISDWTSAAEPGAPVGRETMMNLVEVQPYYLEQPW